MSASSTASSSLRMLPALMNGVQRQRAVAAGDTAETTSAASSSGASSSAASGDFYKQLLTLLALSMTMSSGSSDSSNLLGSSSGTQSSGMGNFMAPVLMTLIEKLLSNQVEQAAPQATTVQAGKSIASGDTSFISDSKTLGDDVPAGSPVNGVLTQAPHPGHMAFDWGIPIGTDVKTTMNGKVIYAGWNNEGYGNLVIVENGPYRTYYGHLSSVPVHVGDTVEAGDLIGKSGNTGNSTGPHIHYEVRQNNRQVDPTPYVRRKKNSDA